MNTTSISLLHRLRQPDDDQAWRRFVHLYSPLLYYWARGVKLPAADAADLVQEVLLVVVEKLPSFAYDLSRSFSGWLRIVALNKWRERCRKFSMMPGMEEAELSALTDGNGTDVFAETEYRQWLFTVSGYGLTHASQR